MPQQRLPSVLSSSRAAGGSQNTVPINPKLIDDVERHAQELSNGVLALIANLTGRMDEITACTGASVDVTHQAATNLAAATDESVQQMNVLIDAVCALKADTGAVGVLSAQIKQVKESLDGLEALIAKG
ncbi:hypothetical protein BDZ88DRAFT_450759 [Geranomyces variabilis]|nr:hypothetical protein BDZ88DRAFT_450759 [Geranomyces variabilis]KAJ3134829.1 hypothetical protein HDU90_004862 [Geranomyces variabilis]